MNAPRKNLLPPPEVYRPTEEADPIGKLLREQAELMRDNTDRTIIPTVSSRASGSSLTHLFTLVVPTLEDYKYQLFSITSNGIDDFPVTLWNGDDSQPIDDMNALEDALRELFSRPATIQLIQKLIALAENPE